MERHRHHKLYHLKVQAALSDGHDGVPEPGHLTFGHRRHSAKSPGYLERPSKMFNLISCYIKLPTKNKYS